MGTTQSSSDYSYFNSNQRDKARELPDISSNNNFF
jgi:hypothetical protein